jgi:hypothetical protein
MPDNGSRSRTPRKWPYRAARPFRRPGVVRSRQAADAATGGVVREEKAPPRPIITPWQVRLLLLGAFFAAVGSGLWWAYRSPHFTVQHVTVEGTRALSADLVRETAALDGDSTFTLDPDGAEARIMALEGVREATVEKTSWNSVRITIDERVAWGSWQIEGKNVPIDEYGYVLDGDPAPDGSPVIVEVAAARVINVGERLDPGAVEVAVRLMRESERSIGRRVQALIYRKDAGLTAVFAPSDVDGNPLWVTFGDSRDYDYKVAALYVLIEQARAEDLALNAVDLRFGDRLSFQ